MKRILGTLVFTCALSLSAFAGEIPTCNPAPTAATATGEIPTNGSESVEGNMPTDGSAVSSEAESSVLTDVLLTIVGLIVP